jgi:hypothetical protein
MANDEKMHGFPAKGGGQGERGARQKDVGNARRKCNTGRSPVFPSLSRWGIRMPGTFISHEPDRSVQTTTKLYLVLQIFSYNRTNQVSKHTCLWASILFFSHRAQYLTFFLSHLCLRYWWGRYDLRSHDDASRELLSRLLLCR